MYYNMDYNIFLLTILSVNRTFCQACSISNHFILHVPFSPQIGRKNKKYKYFLAGIFPVVDNRQPIRPGVAEPPRSPATGATLCSVSQQVFAAIGKIF